MQFLFLFFYRGAGNNTWRLSPLQADTTDLVNEKNFYTLERSDVEAHRLAFGT